MNKVTITLFVTDGCPHCESGREFLRGQGVSFVERDVLADILALHDLLYLTGRSDVPALYVGYEASIGFDAPRWLEVLAHAKELERGDPYILPPVFGKDPLPL